MTTKTITMRSDQMGADGEPLEAGHTYELPAASADHWLKREKADLVADSTRTVRSVRKSTRKVGEGESDAPTTGGDTGGGTILLGDAQ